ncbi:hypothetical protein ACHAXM_008521 [Skeletonema potamos]|jgi:hypothetical protein
MITTLSAFLLTSFSIAELGDGFGMYVDMFLLAKGWGEKSVVTSGIFRGVIDLLLKSFVGDLIDKTHYDRRSFLALAALVIGLSSLMVYFVDGADTSDKILVYVVRSVESIALAFLGPAFAAITLSAFGPEMFDTMNVKREIVSHIGSIFSALLSGGIAWLFYPNIEAVFILPITFASSAVFFSRFIPRGDPLMGRAFHLKTEKRDEQNCVIDTHADEEEPEASGYWEVFSDKRIMGLVAADVFHVIGEANVGLIFNSALAGVGSWSDNDNASSNNDDNTGGDATDEGGTAIMVRSAIPLLAAAGSLAQIVMVIGTWVVGFLTDQGWGRKPFYIVHLSIHPIRVLLILLCMWTKAGKGWLASTELIGGLTGALGIVNVFMRADIVFGSGRFNVVDGYMATVRGLAAVSSQYIGAVILEGQGPFVALSISFVIAVIPPIVGYLFVPETLGMRERDFKEEKMAEKLLQAQAKLGIDKGESKYIEIGSFSSPSKVNSWVSIATTPDTVGSPSIATTPGTVGSMDDIILTPDASVRSIV